MVRRNDYEKKDIRRIIYLIVIIIVCIVAIFEAVYIVMFSADGSLENMTTSTTNTIEIDEKEVLKNNFQTIFKNSLTSNVDIGSISKKDENYDLVYVAYNKVDRVVGKYDLNVQLPHINIDSEEINNINNEIDTIFKEKAESIIDENNEVQDTVYNIKYQAYLNNDILSLVIECTLRENTNVQRIIIKTYNYNINTGKIMSFEELAEIKQLEKNTIEKEIEEEIESQISMEKSLSEAGYTVFNRDAESDMYKFENLNNVFLDENNNLYIIFAYGNANNTGEMDIVIF